MFRRFCKPLAAFASAILAVAYFATMRDVPMAPPTAPAAMIPIAEIA